MHQGSEGSWESLETQQGLPPPSAGGGSRGREKTHRKCGVKELGFQRVGQEKALGGLKEEGWVGVRFLEGFAISKAPPGGRTDGVGWGGAEDHQGGIVGDAGFRSKRTETWPCVYCTGRYFQFITSFSKVMH